MTRNMYINIVTAFVISVSVGGATFQAFRALNDFLTMLQPLK